MHPLPPAETLLLPALRATPRRYRLPLLPGDVETARHCPSDEALAYAIEAARLSQAEGTTPADDVRDLFTASLARLIAEALVPQDGDPSFQALVLQADDARVREYARLLQQRVADTRAVRGAVNAVAHPGKLRTVVDAGRHDALLRLHQLATAESWSALDAALSKASASSTEVPPTVDKDALRRLLRLDDLKADPGVQRYLALCEQRGPAAGSHAAAAQGRASGRVGDAAEHATVRALREIALQLDATQLSVVRSLRTPPGFPGEPGKAKEEWDAAIVRRVDAASPAEIVLLVEVKAAPAAAMPDFSRLHRGLQRLALAQPGHAYTFPSADGEIALAGDSLRRLEPQGRTLPPHAIYCCSAPPETQPLLLAAATKAVLLADANCVRFAQRLAHGDSPSDSELRPVGDALTTEPRLRSALHQYETARTVREAMLHPDDLLAAVLQTAVPSA